MGAVDLLERLRADGFVLTVAADKLLVSPGRDLTEDQRALIRQHKAELMPLIDPDTRVTCMTCRHYLQAANRCRQHRAALLTTDDIAQSLAVLPQHCPAWSPKGAASCTTAST